MADYYSEAVAGVAPGGPAATVTYYDVRTAAPYAVLVTLLLPAAWCVRRVLKRFRKVDGLCARCGYDLRATPGRCPECGRAIVRT